MNGWRRREETLAVNYSTREIVQALVVAGTDIKSTKTEIIWFMEARKYYII